MSLVVGPQTTVGQTAGWRVLFWFGVIPSLLVVLIRARVKEPDRWLRARAGAIGRRIRGGPSNFEHRRDPRCGSATCAPSSATPS